MLISQEKFFEGLDFEYLPNVGWKGSHKGKDGHFYHIDHFDNVYVIEVADSEEEARCNAFEDAYDFLDEWGEEEIIRQVRETLIKMCNGEIN